jgi:voltage-gated potassium channel
MGQRVARKPPSLVRAGLFTAGATLAVVILAAVVIRVVDRESFPSLGRALWWSVQTVTTVGYGDAVPSGPAGRVIAVIVMLAGIGFVTMLSGVVVSVFMKRITEHEQEQARADLLAELDARLDRLERAVGDRPQPRDGPAA